MLQMKRWCLLLFVIVSQLCFSIVYSEDFPKPDILQPDVDLDVLSLTAIQIPWIIMALLFSVVVYFWWIKGVRGDEALTESQ